MEILLICLVLLVVGPTVVIFGTALILGILLSKRKSLDPQERAKQEQARTEAKSERERRKRELQEQVARRSMGLNPMVHAVLLELSPILRPSADWEEPLLGASPVLTTKPVSEYDFFISFQPKSGTWEIVWRRKVEHGWLREVHHKGSLLESYTPVKEGFSGFTVVLTQPELDSFSIRVHVYIGKVGPTWEGLQWREIRTADCSVAELRNALLTANKDYGPTRACQPCPVHWDLSLDALRRPQETQFEDTIFTHYPPLESAPQGVQQSAYNDDFEKPQMELATLSLLEREPLVGEVILLDERATNELFNGLSLHVNCRVIATNKRLILQDPQSDTDSFELSACDLRQAKLERIHDTGLKIQLASGSRHEISLDAVQRERLIARIQEIAEAE